LRSGVTGSPAFAGDDTPKAGPTSASAAAPLTRLDGFIVPLAAAEARDASRVGPKAANLAALAAAGLPTPGGFCIAADAYRTQIAALGLDDAVASYTAAEPREQRRLAVDIRLTLYQQPIAPEILRHLLEAWREQRAASGRPGAVRSSALIEDRAGASCAGQFESFLGIADEDAMLTAVRACWAALWTSQGRTYMDRHGLSPAGTAMAILVQPLIDARASGGGLSENGDGHMLLSAAWGLGTAVAQGEIVPDHIVLTRAGFLRTNEVGRKDHRDTCGHGPQVVPRELAEQPCLAAGEAVALGRLLRRAEAVLGMPVEIEWALDDFGFKLLQARPLVVAPATVPDDIWLRHPRLNGHPAGIGWATGRAVVANCECELSRIAPGDILVTRVAGPSLGGVLPRVAGVVAELGGSTSHLASLARERGIPMVLGVRNATAKIPDGAQVAVDSVAGIVRWID
jgi:pyruvate,water dikinase